MYLEHLSQPNKSLIKPRKGDKKFFCLFSKEGDLTANNAAPRFSARGPGETYIFTKDKTFTRMKKNLIPLSMLTVVGLISLISFASREDAGPALKMADMIADWERAKAYTLEYLSAANEDVIAFQPAPEMRTFGEQMLHIAESNYAFASTASGKSSPITFGTLEQAFDDHKTKEALTEAVMKSYDFMISALKEADVSELDGTVTVFNRFKMSREVAYQKAFEHQTHHRGQTTVYLRLKGIKPPNEKLL
jgi:uncharacterized damage-inducible protein DinB